MNVLCTLCDIYFLTAGIYRNIHRVMRVAPCKPKGGLGRTFPSSSQKEACADPWLMCFNLHCEKMAFSVSHLASVDCCSALEMR